jgi:NAD-dependent SIR2 family protein deacetylase
MQSAIAAARTAMESANSLFILAGAGMGVDSGLPDFRGDQGFWRAYPALAERRISFAEMANPRWFDEDPRLAWAFYGHRLDLYRRTQPHAGFALLRQEIARRNLDFFIFTSNVDGQFQKAGFASANIAECHGSLHHFQCRDNCRNAIWPAPDPGPEVDLEAFTVSGELPKCQYCGSLARPNVLMFGDWQWQAERSEAQMRRLQQWLAERDGGHTILVECGAGTAVATVRHMAENTARALGATLIRINPHAAEVPKGHIGVAARALIGLKEIFA